MHPFEVMAEPIRRSIVEMLASGEHTSGNIEEIVTSRFGVGRSAVQHHLSLLRRVGWVIVREEETLRWYRLDPSVIAGLRAAVRRLRKRWDRRIGWVDGTDPGAPILAARSRKGRRGHGRDPDDPWWRFD